MQITLGLALIDLGIVVVIWAFMKIAAAFTHHANLIVQSVVIRDSQAHGEAGFLLELKGRREGLVPFLLTLVGLSPTTMLTVDRREVVCTSAGILGMSSRSLPLDRIPQVTYGSRKPGECIFIAALTLMVGLLTWLGSVINFDVLAVVGVPIVTAVFVGLPILLYRLNKRFFLCVYSQGGTSIDLAFKPNLIEGVQLDLDRTVAFAVRLTGLVIDAGMGGRGDEAVAATRMPLPPSRRPITEPPGAAGVQQVPGMPVALPAGVGVSQARRLLMDAQECIRSGRRDEAIAKLRSVISQFPSSAESEQARKALDRAGVSGAL